MVSQSVTDQRLQPRPPPRAGDLEELDTQTLWNRSKIKAVAVRGREGKLPNRGEDVGRENRASLRPGFCF